MELILNNYQIISGAFADVLIDQNKGKALKLFKSYQHPHLDGTGKEQIGEEKINEYRKKVFRSELDAYNLVQHSEFLKQYTPIFYGQINFDSVLNNNTDVTHYYLDNCCFELEYIKSEFYKWKHIQYDFSQIFQEFNRTGIQYYEDSSASIRYESICIIDFATINPQFFEFELKMI